MLQHYSHPVLTNSNAAAEIEAETSAEILESRRRLQSQTLFFAQGRYRFQYVITLPLLHLQPTI